MKCLKLYLFTAVTNEHSLLFQVSTLRASPLLIYFTLTWSTQQWTDSAEFECFTVGNQLNSVKHLNFSCWMMVSWLSEYQMSIFATWLQLIEAGGLCQVHWWDWRQQHWVYRTDQLVGLEQVGPMLRNQAAMAVALSCLMHEHRHNLCLSQCCCRQQQQSIFDWMPMVEAERGWTGIFHML